MGKYIKEFETHEEYSTYINGQNKILPNVSHCINNKDVHYNPLYLPIIAKYDVTDTSSATTLLNSMATRYFSEMEIDGVVQPSVVSSYTFDTTGEHTVKYTLIDPTTIGISTFSNCRNLTSINIPDGVTTIGQGAFRYCTGLTSVTIPNSVTEIESNAFTYCTNLTSVTIGESVLRIQSYAFNGCGKLTSITSLATTAPTIQSNTFKSIKSGGTLTVPTGSTGYDVWMGTSNYYLGKYNWTKVEQ